MLKKSLFWFKRSLFNDQTEHINFSLDPGWLIYIIYFFHLSYFVKWQDLPARIWQFRYSMLSIDRFSQFIVVLKKSDIFSFQDEKFDVLYHLFLVHQKKRKERNKARKENNNNNKLICTTQGNKINQVISIHFIILKNISCTPVRIGWFSCFIYLCKRSYPVGVSKVILKIITGGSSY